MQEQEAVQVYHLDEWVFIGDDDEPERAWQDEKQALADFKADAWEVATGPAGGEPTYRISRAGSSNKGQTPKQGPCPLISTRLPRIH